MTHNETTREINLTPDFGRMFDLMLKEASRQGQAKLMFGDFLGQREELEALRAYQRFLAPLAIAANAMTTFAAVERFRDMLTELSTGLAQFADQFEREIQEDEAGPAECDCAERSWYGDVHDSACPLAGRERES